MTERLFTWDELDALDLPYGDEHDEIPDWDFPRRAVVFEHEGRHWRVEFNDTEATDGPLWDGEDWPGDWESADAPVGVKAIEVRKVEQLVEVWEPTKP